MITTFINLKPNIGSNHPRHVLPPLDIGYCASLLEKSGNKADLIDLNINNQSINKLLSHVKENKSNVLVIKAAINTTELTLELSKKIKDAVKKIFLLGPFASLYYKDFIFKGSPIDLVILDEPELTLLELVENLKKNKSINHTAGIAYYNKKIIKTEQRPLINNLDSLPFPKQEFFVNKRYPFYYPVNIKKKINVGYILSSRGCQYNCVFCLPVERDSYGKAFRMRNPKNVVDEMKLLRSKGVNVIYFIDDFFTGNSKYVLNICDEIINRKLNLKWIAQCRIDSLNKDLLVKMKKAGCSTLCLGIESGSDRVLKILNKGINKNQITETVKMIKEQGIMIMADFIIGSPTETKNEMKDSLNLAKKLCPEMINISLFAIYNPKNFDNKYKNFSRFDVTSNFSKLNDKELKQFQKYFYLKFCLSPEFISKLILKQGIFTVLNWRKFIFDVLRYLSGISSKRLIKINES